jgi:putative ABC transport system permease protein
MKVSKIPVKDIVLNKIDKVSKKNRWKPVLGIIFILAALVLPRIVPRDFALLVDGLCMVLCIVAVIFCIPALTLGFVKIFDIVNALAFGNEGIIAAKNLKGNKSMLNSISLLAIGISSLLMINTVSSSVMDAVLNLFTNSISFDIMFSIPKADKNAISKIKSIDGVNDVYGLYETGGIQIKDSTDTISFLQGASPDKHSNYWKIDMSEDPQKLLNEVDKGRNIILTDTYKDKFSLKKGDYFSIKTN